MTAYLQPGDQIYLAVPSSPTSRTREDAIAEGKAQADGITQMLAPQGVTVLGWSSHSQLTHPLIVAVLRRGPAIERDHQ